ncbi:MAG: hypothetical protein DRN91_02835 [Candidatus Alkanophagales archaeon]|nr:MAG: hypothetical protein DRN91_02835 [Candidatus Alkanophagales archaeon]
MKSLRTEWRRWEALDDASNVVESQNGGDSMADIVVICRDGMVNSYISSLIAAIETKKAGGDVAVIFTQEALVALAERKFRLAPLLEGYKSKIEENAKKLGLAADPVALVKAAKDAGVRLIACPAWVGLTEIKVPAELETPDVAEVLRIIGEAKKVIGTF